MKKAKECIRIFILFQFMVHKKFCHEPELHSHVIVTFMHTVIINWFFLITEFYHYCCFTSEGCLQVVELAGSADNVTFDDGSWHKLVATRIGSQGRLILDDSLSGLRNTGEMGYSPPTSRGSYPSLYFPPAWVICPWIICFQCFIVSQMGWEHYNDFCISLFLYSNLYANVVETKQISSILSANTITFWCWEF